MVVTKNIISRARVFIVFHNVYIFSLFFFFLSGLKKDRSTRYYNIPNSLLFMSITVGNDANYIYIYMQLDFKQLSVGSHVICNAPRK